MKKNLQVLGLKTFLVMMIDLLLVAITLFGGILSALAFDKEPWGQGFWMWSMIGIGSSLGSGSIGWWAWLQLRYKE